VLTRLSLIPLLVVCACAPEYDEVSLYEDDPYADLEGKADGTGLTPRFAVENYEARMEARDVVEPLAARTFLEERQIPAGEKIVVLRSFDFEGEPTVVVAEDRTYELSLVTAAALEERTTPATDDVMTSFRYLATLGKTRRSLLCELQAGSDSAIPTRFTLSINMNPSRREWEEGLFEWLLDLAAERDEAVPVGIAMTGLWAHRHSDEFLKLVAWQERGLLDIRWVNHSYHHPLNRNAGGGYDFLTHPSVDFTAEVLDLEVLLLEQGVMFSSLFRFPGLTHDDATLQKLAGLGLFPLDANAWVARDEPIGDGSVALLHGNGNEHVGVTMFLDWARPRADLFARGELGLTDAIGTLPVPGESDDLPSLQSLTTCAP
jgi:hypothetical protein